MMNPMFSRLALVIVCVLALSGSVCAQGDTGQLNGTVVDANGAQILGATVTLISQTTSQLREAVTRESGNFTFTIQPPGRYKIEVIANGFKTTLIEDVRSNITQTTTLLVHLDVAAATPGALTITSVPPLVQQESSQIGRVIEEQTIRQLPWPTRNSLQISMTKRFSEGLQ